MPFRATHFIDRCKLFASINFLFLLFYSFPQQGNASPKCNELLSILDSSKSPSESVKSISKSIKELPKGVTFWNARPVKFPTTEFKPELVDSLRKILRDSKHVDFPNIFHQSLPDANEITKDLLALATLDEKRWLKMIDQLFETSRKMKQAFETENRSPDLFHANNLFIYFEAHLQEISKQPFEGSLRRKLFDSILDHTRKPDYRNLGKVFENEAISSAGPGFGRRHADMLLRFLGPRLEEFTSLKEISSENAIADFLMTTSTAYALKAKGGIMISPKEIKAALESSYFALNEILAEHPEIAGKVELLFFGSGPNGKGLKAKSDFDFHLLFPESIDETLRDTFRAKVELSLRQKLYKLGIDTPVSLDVAEEPLTQSLNSLVSKQNLYFSIQAPGVRNSTATPNIHLIQVPSPKVVISTTTSDETIPIELVSKVWNPNIDWTPRSQLTASTRIDLEKFDLALSEISRGNRNYLFHTKPMPEQFSEEKFMATVWNDDWTWKSPDEKIYSEPKFSLGISNQEIITNSKTKETTNARARIDELVRKYQFVDPFNQIRAEPGKVNQEIASVAPKVGLRSLADKIMGSRKTNADAVDPIKKARLEEQGAIRLEKAKGLRPMPNGIMSEDERLRDYLATLKPEVLTAEQRKQIKEQSQSAAEFYLDYLKKLGIKGEIVPIIEDELSSIERYVVRVNSSDPVLAKMRAQEWKGRDETVLKRAKINSSHANGLVEQIDIVGFWSTRTAAAISTAGFVRYWSNSYELLNWSRLNLMRMHEADHLNLAVLDQFRMIEKPGRGVRPNGPHGIQIKSENGNLPFPRYTAVWHGQELFTFQRELSVLKEAREDVEEIRNFLYELRGLKRNPMVPNHAIEGRLAQLLPPSLLSFAENDELFERAWLTQRAHAEGFLGILDSTLERFAKQTFPAPTTYIEEAVKQPNGQEISIVYAKIPTPGNISTQKEFMKIPLFGSQGTTDARNRSILIEALASQRAHLFEEHFKRSERASPFRSIDAQGNDVVNKNRLNLAWEKYFDEIEGIRRTEDGAADKMRATSGNDSPSNHKLNRFFLPKITEAEANLQRFFQIWQREAQIIPIESDSVWLSHSLEATLQKLRFKPADASRWKPEILRCTGLIP